MKLLKFLALVGLFTVSFQAVADVIIQWTAPTVREDGKALPLSEVGGFEIRYRKTTDAATVPDTVIVIPDNKAVEYPIIGVTAASYKFTIAAFDTEGLYSDHAVVNYTVAAKPTPPTAVKVAAKTLNVVAACVAAAPLCKVAVVGEWK